LENGSRGFLHRFRGGRLFLLFLRGVFQAIAEDFGGSRLGVAIGLTVTNAVGAIAAPYVGRALDKYPLRNVMGIGAIFMAVGFLGLSFVQNELQFYLVLGLFIGFGASSMGNLATSKLVTNWFDRPSRHGFGHCRRGCIAVGCDHALRQRRIDRELWLASGVFGFQRLYLP
jgi:MFS family permease